MEIKLTPEAARIVGRYADEHGLTLMEAAAALIAAGGRETAPAATAALDGLRVLIEQVLSYQRYLLRHTLFVSVLLQRRLAELHPDIAEATLADIERQIQAYIAEHL